jgi:glycosyltransferase involved in cell wall biosynthesis
VIPVRNRPDVLRRNLSALASQDFASKDFEVLVCDDGSTDDILSVVERFRMVLNVQLLKQKPKGPAAARNLGIRKSIAPIVIFLDSDVWADKALIRHLVTTLDKNPEWMGVEAKIESAGGNPCPLWDAPVCDDGRRYHTAAIAYRRDALVKAGGFDETFKLPACEDVDLAARILRMGSIGFVPEAIAHHPIRSVRLKTHWRWRRHWKYEMILAKRYGFLSFPGHSAGPFPRLRLALAAVITLPAGRFIEGVKYIGTKPSDGLLACLYALFDVFCGFWALPNIFFSRIPLQRNYLLQQK